MCNLFSFSAFFSSPRRFLPCRVLQPVTSLEAGYLKDNNFDTVCVIDGAQVPAQLKACFSAHESVDAAFNSEICCFRSGVLDCRVVYAPLGTLTDFDDVRRFGEAAGKALDRAIKAGAKQPLLVLPAGCQCGFCGCRSGVDSGCAGQAVRSVAAA